MNKKNIKSLIFTIITTIVLSTCFIFTGCAREDKYSEALKIGTSQMPKTLMPYVSTDAANMYVTGMIYDTLLSNVSVPAGFIDGEEYIFENGDKFDSINETENYFYLADGLVEVEGAYEKKDGSDYGWELFTPTDEQYQAQLEKKNIQIGVDEVGVSIPNETQEEFEARRELSVPKDNWIRYRFKVVEGHTWNDGVPFTAKDIEFTFKYVLKNSGKLGSIAFFLNNYYDCYTDDNGDFVLELASNKLSDIKTIATSIFIIPEHIWKDIRNPDEEKNINPVGTGAYKIADDGFVEDSSLALVLRDDYNSDFIRKMFAYEPIKSIFMMRVSNEDVMLNALQKGDIDVSLDGISVAKVNAIKNNSSYSNIKICETRSDFVSTLVLNVGENGGFNEKNLRNSDMVREAISLAIDQQRLIDEVLYGSGITVGGGLVQSFMSHARTDENGTYINADINIEKANKLLDEAGYLVDSTTGMRTLSFDILALPSNEVLINAIGAMLKENIKIEINYVQADGEYNEKIKQRNNPDFDMIINSVTFSSDKLLMFDARFGTYPNGQCRVWNFSGVKNKELTKLMWEMDTCSDIVQQQYKAQQVQKMVDELNVELPLYSGKNYSVFTDLNFEGWVEPNSGSILNQFSMRYLQKK